MRLRPTEALGVPRGARLRARPARAAGVQDQPPLLRQPARANCQAGENVILSGVERELQVVISLADICKIV